MGDQTRERRAADAIEDGLRLYSQGDLRAALGVWRGALEMDPDNKRARDYVRFVEENFDILDEKIRTARARRVSEERVATAMATGSAIEMEADDGYEGEGDDDDYAAFEVDSEVGEAVAADGDDAEVTVEKVPETKRTLQGWDSKVLHRDAAARVVESVDEGWDLDGLDEFLGTGTSGGAFPRPQLDDATEPMAERTPGDEESLMSDPEAGELTLPAPRAMKISVPPPPSIDPYDMGDFAPDALETAQGPRGVVPRGAVPPAMPPEPEPPDVRVSFRNSTAPPPSREAMPPAGPDEETIDRRGSWAIPATDGDVPPLERPRRAPTEDPSIGASAVEVDDQLLSFEDQTKEARRIPMSAMEDAIADLGPGVEPPVDPDGDRPTQLYARPAPAAGGARAPQTISLPMASAELAAELDDAVAGEEGTPENIAARVRWLFERAGRELQAGRFPLAAVAVDLALAEHPDSAVAQKIVHTHRDLVMEVYRNYLGDLGLVPALAQPIEAIPVHELDHRAAFLLTRVDGVLTLEDILDVSGMARLEAYRHLCRLLMRGFLAVR